MSRTRKLKPEFFTNENLAECSPYARLVFAGLWTLADRDGRLEDRPKRIKAKLLPYDDQNMDELLQELHEKGFIVRYEVENLKCIELPTFLEHQTPHPKEQSYNLPERQEEIKSHDPAIPKNEKKLNANHEMVSVSKGYKDSRIKGLKDSRGNGGGEVVAVFDGCKWFRMAPPEHELARKWYREKGYPPEAISDVAAQIDNWLDTDTPNARRARARKDSHHRRLYDPNFIDKGLKVFHRKVPNVKPTNLDVAISEYRKYHEVAA